MYNGLDLEAGRAICYSGYRDGQNPGTGIYPSYEEVKEDLQILSKNWKYLRLYDCGPHAETILEVIRKEKMDFKVMQGAYIGAEMNNFGCPWGAIYPEKQLLANREGNVNEINKLIKLANSYPDIIFALSAGNEATVDWTDHFVSDRSVIEYVEMLKDNAKQPVTFCENYIPWQGKLKKLVEAVDFISIHTYPVWEYKHIHDALNYTKENYYSVAGKYPNKPVAITEAGWATNSNGRGIEAGNASEEFQEIYYHDLMNWCEKEGILCFFFEAFDEPWKGSPEEMEPEKHWGLFYKDRTPKKVMQPLFKPA